MTRRQTAVTLLLAATRFADAAIHHGVYVDPAHCTGTGSWAGMRTIAEDPPHVLTMIGSDDGDAWWKIEGSCSGADMSRLTFDFSSKGGPSDLQGNATDFADGTSAILWDDVHCLEGLGTQRPCPQVVH